MIEGLQITDTVLDSNIQRLGQLSSSKIIFHRKRDQRKQFLLNIRKINHRKWKERTQEVENNRDMRIEGYDDKKYNTYQDRQMKMKQKSPRKVEQKRFNTDYYKNRKND